jgi:hypothetical protein
MTTTASLDAVVAFWAARLGCAAAQLALPATSVVRNGPDLADYRGATVFLRPPACVVAVPEDWYEWVAARVGHWPPGEVFDAALSRQVFGAAVERVVGPAWLGYADASDHRSRGYGKAVVSTMTTHGLHTGGVVQYRTLQANLPSVGIARSLGFQHFAHTLAIRLVPRG